MTTWLALVKVPADATADDVRRSVPGELEMLADRLVSEYGIDADTVEDWLEAAIDAAHEAAT